MGVAWSLIPDSLSRRPSPSLRQHIAHRNADEGKAERRGDFFASFQDFGNVKGNAVGDEDDGSGPLSHDPIEFFLQLVVGGKLLAETDGSVLADDKDMRELGEPVVLDHVRVPADQDIVGKLVVSGICFHPSGHVDGINGDDGNLLVLIEDLLERRKLRPTLPSLRFPEVDDHDLLVLEFTQSSAI